MKIITRIFGMNDNVKNEMDCYWKMVQYFILY